MAIMAVCWTSATAATVGRPRLVVAPARSPCSFTRRASIPATHTTAPSAFRCGASSIYLRFVSLPGNEPDSIGGRCPPECLAATAAGQSESVNSAIHWLVAFGNACGALVSHGPRIGAGRTAIGSCSPFRGEIAIRSCAPGYRVNKTGALNAVGDGGYSWSSSVSGSTAFQLDYYPQILRIYPGNRAHGFQVRCLQHLPGCLPLFYVLFLTGRPSSE